jgi:hypothetical protein
MGVQKAGSGRRTLPGRSWLAATRRLGAVALTVFCLGAASLPSAQVASAGLLGGVLGPTVRVIITADSVGSAQGLVLSLLGRVVNTLPIINGVVADVNPSLLPLLSGLLGVTVTPDAPVVVGSTTTSVNLGTAAAASVLAGTGVTNTGPSVLNLDLTPTRRLRSPALRPG